jgi:CRISPR system Cascade subunit CasC
MSKFLQFHTLTSYPGTLLNRDDAGFAKTLPFGNAKRTRVSSQCLKYHWREYEGKHALRDAGDMAIRSRRTFRQKIAEPVAEDYPPGLAAAAAHYLSEYITSGERLSAGDLKKIITADDPMSKIHKTSQGEDKQILALGLKEVNHMRTMTREVVAEAAEVYDAEDVLDARDAIQDALKGRSNDMKDTLDAMRNAMGIDAAMHGRMVTSDALSQGDAAVHVAHAITTHAQQREDDYFTAVDKLDDSDQGSAHLNTKQLTSGLFYSYVVVDVPLLVSNLEACKRSEWLDADLDLTTDVMQRFLWMLTTVSPGAKLSSTAPYAKAEFVMVESGEEQPRTLANAFKQAVDTRDDLDGDDVTRRSVQALTEYVRGVDEMYAPKNDDGTYEPHEARICATSDGSALPAERAGVPEIEQWIAEHIQNHQQHA